ncbi:beta-galactosidase B [Penicillium riverlandense]|uniref:beta-galactosidase B n=1 Tax=Penicillium riverlandense TaxID=1903569 RepID=UPI002548831C|nr:beta-galactosidase B [Penicillium riverlandense]KAJ5832920.1 beta-galactosidase B [Penicillium riverlandense]
MVRLASGLASWASSSLLLCCAIIAARADDSDWPIKSTNYTDTVQWDHYSYFINGQRAFLFGGEMHPFRLPVPELWEDILQKMKAMGMNTMSFYSLWGYHEPVPGKVDTETGGRDLTRLLNYAREVGMFVTPRPGPYINGELNAGGFPLWLTTGAYGTLRSNGSAYTEAWEPYQSAVAQLVAPFQVYRNGTVISYQIENELPNQWIDKSSKTPDTKHIDYMEKLEENARANGIGIPFTHNSPNNDWSWSSDWDTPLCWSCNPSQCSSSHPAFTLLDYVSYFDTYSPSQPSYMPEFQGGKVVPLTGFPDGCADTVGLEYRNIYYRHNIDQGLTAIMSYMTYGGTNWGWLGVPFLGSSYDYSAPIAEDRSLRDSFFELKNLALFTRVAYDLRKTDRIASGTNYTTNPLILATELRNPDNGAGFYVVRHNDSTSSTPVTFKIQLDTSVGRVTVPAHESEMTLSGHIAKILVTDLSIGEESIIYSTAEVLTYAVIEGETTLVLWTPAGEGGEAYITGASTGTLLTSHQTNVRFRAAEKGTIITFEQPIGLTVAQVGKVKVLVVDRSVANFIFVPSLSADPLVPVNETVVVSGPYLVRGASIDSHTIYVTGDTVNATQIEVFAPHAVKKVAWNGKVLKTERTSYGSLKARLSGPVRVKLPKLGPWKGQDSLPEILLSYSDTSLAWIEGNHSTTHNSGSGTVPYLYSDDYGFHTGSFLYRGRFNGTAAGVNMTVYGGESAGYSVYLNGKFIGAFLGSSSSSGSLTLDFPNDTLVESGPNVLAVVADTSGHDEGGGATSVRGIYQISLTNTTGPGFSSWRMAGTAGGADGVYLDPVRGAYNEAGWQAERLGWHLPGYDDSFWPASSPSEGFANATVRFYRTTVPLNIPEGHDASIVFNLQNLGSSSAVRALLYVNGYQYGRYNPYVNEATEFPVPPGILNYKGDNVICLLVWAQSTSGAAISLDWSVTEVRESSFNPRIDAGYLQPRWNATRLNYA